MVSAELHTLLEELDAGLVVAQPHGESSEVEIDVLGGGERIEVPRDLQNVALEVALHLIVRVGNVVHEHLLELVEHLALVATQSHQRQDVLQRRRRRLVMHASLQLRETVGVERQKDILPLTLFLSPPPTRTPAPAPRRRETQPLADRSSKACASCGRRTTPHTRAARRSSS